MRGRAEEEPEDDEESVISLDQSEGDTEASSPSSSLSEDSRSSSSSCSEDLPPFDLRSDLNADMKKWKEKIRYSSRYKTDAAEYR